MYTLKNILNSDGSLQMVIMNGHMVVETRYFSTPLRKDEVYNAYLSLQLKIRTCNRDYVASEFILKTLHIDFVDVTEDTKMMGSNIIG